MGNYSDILKYDPETGVLNWLRTGRRAGCRRPDGYIVVRVAKRKLLYAHRIAFDLMGCDEPKAVDHINGDPSDNRWANLRACTQSQNLANRGGYHGSSNSSKYKGVARYKDKWTASVMHDYKKHHIGVFATEYEAAIAYNMWAKEFFGEFAFLNEVAQ